MTAEQRGAGGGGAHVFLDVLDDEVGAGEVIDVGPAFRVVHGVGEVAHEHGGAAIFDHATQAEGPAKDAHVGVNSDEEDVGELAMLEEVPDFDPGIADGVFVADLDDIDLAQPRGVGIAALCFQPVGPFGLGWFGGVATAVGLVDGVGAIFFCGNAVAPGADFGGKVGCLGGFLGTAPGGKVFVRGEATAGGMDDESAARAGFDDEAIQVGGQFSDPVGGVLAVVQVPHIADDHGRLPWGPGGGFLDDLPGSVGLFRTAPGLPGDRVRGGVGAQGRGDGQGEAGQAHGSGSEKCSSLHDGRGVAARITGLWGGAGKRNCGFGGRARILGERSGLRMDEAFWGREGSNCRFGEGLDEGERVWCRPSRGEPDQVE